MKISSVVSSGSMRLGLRLVLCFGVIVFVVVGSFFLLPTSIYYHVSEKYYFAGDDEGSLVFLAVMLPKSGPYQSVKNLEILWSGSVQIEEYDGLVDVVRLSGEKRANTEQFAEIEYDVRLPRRKIAWVAPVYDFQLLPQAGIESDSPCIREQIDMMETGNLGHDAYEIYRFTVEHLTYSRQEIGCTCTSAEVAFEAGKSVCAGYARVMTALCRASDIPAQMVLGVVYPDSMFKQSETSFPEDPNESHAWVEYYSEGSWKMADPTWGEKNFKFMQFDRNDGRHLAYGEVEDVFAYYSDMRNWATEGGQILLGEQISFRYIATSTSSKISLLPTVSVQQSWDGRWFNTLIVWAGLIWVLSRNRKRIIKLDANSYIV